jgi:16S rRNA (guanine966-N2)-methyltransferase
MHRSKSTVTIAGGVWRGRSLVYPHGSDLRPSMQRTRSSLFSSLGERVPGAVFADLFAGGGAVGLEALSRGAARAHFVERNRDAVAAIRENVRVLGIPADRAVVHATTVAAILDAEPCPIADATIVFADPPYDIDVNNEMLQRLRANVFAQLETVVVEHRVRTVLEPPAGLVVTRARRFGDTVLTTLSPAGGIA